MAPVVRSALQLRHILHMQQQVCKLSGASVQRMRALVLMKGEHPQRMLGLPNILAPGVSALLYLSSALQEAGAWFRASGEFSYLPGSWRRGGGRWPLRPRMEQCSRAAQWGP